MNFSGQSLSWCNGHVGLSRSWARLDCMLLNVTALNLFPDAHMKYLHRSSSDHAPLQVFLEAKREPYGFRPFKFQQMWVSHDQFLSCVSQAFHGDEGRGSKLETLVMKLKCVKPALCIWNKQVFGRTDRHIVDLEDRIRGLEESLQNAYSEDAETKLVVSQVELSIWIDREEQRLSQQAKQSWIQKGKESAKFFYAVIRRNQKEVKIMQLEDGSCLTSPEQIHEGEVHDAMMSISIDSSPGPNGFGWGFYRSCWHIVGSDLVDAVVEFFRAKLISPEQGAFTPSRSIFENISLMQEMIHSINMPNFGGNVVMKINMAKAYDSIDWGFLLHTPQMVLQKIQRMLCNLFWGTTDGKPKRKWCFWDAICKPISEGGLGVRNLRQEKTEEVLEQLGSVKVGKDRILWLSNSDGMFTTQSAWNCVRIKGHTFP
ncbi:uncharacterized protein LOC118348628 [Juglans regia]|uniref:Uncharacterized protein LOC118348628 n=1 Tax=Juglans regia TaxID=51240 RepID=A0A6P9EGH6_JUGRE|nr:uncharacterized protein LOC118348628 [Juglans regia]